MPRKPKDEETIANPPVRGPKLRITIPLSPSATAEVRSKAAVYRGLLTQEQFVGLIGVEVEQRLPVILRQIIAGLESDRRQRLGLELPPVAVEAVRTPEDDQTLPPPSDVSYGEDPLPDHPAPAAASGPARVEFLKEEERD